MPGSDAQQPSFADVEYGNRRRRTRRDQFLAMMTEVIPWDEWTGLIVPFYPTTGRRGRQPVPVETMLRMYLLQVWFSLSDEGTEDAIYDSYAFRTFLGLDFTPAQVPDATTLLHFRHLIEQHDLGKAFLDAQTRFFEANGWIMRGGSVIDATIIAAPSSTKNAAGARDPEMHQTQKGNQWHFGMKAHTGVDAGTGYVHTVTVTAANAGDITEAAKLMRPDDEVGYADAGYQGVQKRPEIIGDQQLAKIEWRVAARKSKLKLMPVHDQQVESRKASVRAKVEHPYLIVKRDFKFTKARYRGLAKNHNLLQVLFTSANLLMRTRAVQIAGVPGR
ncbi:IS5 family transposase [Flexivirga caeni]|uniref:IS5 family transposase n=1 Tax=Flexivirga caeni TaxID=2294115 RepID=A0A3M9MGW1_9MICO|nr:IS5 family transposase [Flexivirga caeni]RNI24734.1 IS5 family transposase [Flexivirga caeni]